MPRSQQIFSAVAALGLLVTVNLLVRTELVIGGYVREQVERRAGAAGADVEILTVSPAGLFGLELEEVAARIPRGDFAVEVAASSVEVHPDLGALLSGDARVAELEIEDATIGVRPWRRHRKPAPVSSPKKKKKPAKATSSGPGRSPSSPIDITLRDVDFVAVGEEYSTHPLKLVRLGLRWDPAKRRAIDPVGYGELPDGVPFSLVSDERRIRIGPAEPTRIDRWIDSADGVASPVAISSRDISVCPDCDDVVRLEDVELSAPFWREDVRLTAPTAAVRRDGAVLSLGAPEMAIVDVQTRDFAARLTEVDVRYAFDSGKLGGVIQLADTDGGLLDVEWRWDVEDFDVAFAAQSFRLQDVWHLSGLDRLARPGRVDGTATTSYDVRRATVSATTDLRLSRLEMMVPWSNERFTLREPRLELDAYFDLAGRAMSINRAAMTLAGTKPMHGTLHVIDAGKGVSFDGRFAIERQDADVLLRHLPDQWTSELEGMKLEGTAGLWLSATGHTAFPESLVLDGAIASDVKVLEEATAADPGKVGRSGPPPGFDPESWTPLRAIPRQVRRIILAAEDAKFQQHAGFDWAGLRRAWVHNIEAGRPERGGSTVSQQVAKNLWLDGERTLRRKLQEAVLTWRLESEQPKRRILEIYLNIASWGPGTKGIGAAATRYFDARPRELAVPEVALLSAILPNPARFGGWIEDGYLASSRMEKVEHVFRNLRYLDEITPEQYRAWWSEAQEGRIGRLELNVCSDRPEDDATYDECP